jgi:hypothetical protein
MIYDDWIFVEKYGVKLEDFWYWFLWYFGYCFIAFTVYYWIIVSAGVVVYIKLQKLKD